MVIQRDLDNRNRGQERWFLMILRGVHPEHVYLPLFTDKDGDSCDIQSTNIVICKMGLNRNVFFSPIWGFLINKVGTKSSCRKISIII